MTALTPSPRLLARAVAALWLGLVAFPGPVAAATVSADTSPFASVAFSSIDPAVRFRSQSGGAELYVGTNLGSGSNRNSTNFTYVATQSFSATFDTASNVVSATYGASTASEPVAAPSSAVNALLVAITGPRYNGGSGGAANTFALSGLSVNGMPVSPAGALEGPLPPAPRGTKTYYIWGFQIASSYTLEGTLTYSGPLGANGSQEAAKVDIQFGSLTPVPLPPAATLLIVGIGGLVVLRRRPGRATA
ncbi:MAG: hypothetical protein V2I65_14090 [Paracoccaceae bacterium]|jgi:hypothetical protein|nr:hypothetical protein [Paracoccaceae bacterium]